MATYIPLTAIVMQLQNNAKTSTGVHLSSSYKVTHSANEIKWKNRVCCL